MLASGTVVGQAILILTTPLITRLYTPEQFGVLAVFAGLLGTVSVVACLRFEMAIPLPKRDGAAFQVVGLALVSLVLVTLITSAMGFGIGQALLVKVGATALAPYYWLLPMAVFFAGAYQLSSLWATRSKSFRVLALTRVQQGAGAAGSQVALGLSHFGSLGLIIGQMLGQTLGLFRLGQKLYRDFMLQRVVVTRRGMKWALHRYFSFLKYDTAASLLNTAGAQVPAILFAAYFNPALAGSFLISVRVLSAPITLIGKTMMQVLLPDLVTARYNGSLPVKILKMQRLLAALGLGPFAVVALLAPLGFGKFFGTQWGDVGEIAAWTAIWVGFQFVYSPLSAVFVAVEAQRTNLILQSIFFITRFLSIYLCYHYRHPEWTIISFSIVSAIYYIVGNVVIDLKSGIRLPVSLLEITASIILALFVSSPVVIVILWKASMPALVISLIVATILWVTQFHILSRIPYFITKASSA